MLLRIVLVLCVSVLVAACSSFNVPEPDDYAVVLAPSPIKFALVGNPSVSQVRALEGTTDYSGQLSYVSQTRAEANLTLPAGRHVLALSGDVPCWYCGGGTFHGTQQRTVCVVPQTPSAAPAMTPRSNAAGNLSWSAASLQSLVVATDSGMPATRWIFRRAGGFASDRGLIESARFPNACLRSVDAAQNAPVGLACCDTNDTLQLWQALPAPGWPAGNLRVQNTGRGVSDACLTEGPAPGKVLIQRGCNDTPEQVWTIRDNQTGQNTSSPFF